MRSIAKRFRSNVSGATAIEYGLIATLIALVIIGGLSAIGGANNNKYNSIAGAVANSM